jgi:membrane protein YdbS with pleckstrin-like domain
MYELIRRWTLVMLKVPPEPHPPFGDPASLRVFNAGRNYFRLRMAGWLLAQTLALAGFIFWTALLLGVESEVMAKKAAQKNRSPAGVALNAETKPQQDNWQKRMGEKIGKAAAEVRRGPKKHTAIHPWNGFKQMWIEFAQVLPAGAFVLLWGVKILSFLVYLAQIPVTYAIRRLDYEMRWYMVTDRSLRLRSGVWRVSEATMSFANIQQVSVSQGPLQRLLGLADLKVQSAGGGSGGGHYNHESNDMHTGLFENVTNAREIRDLISERLRRFREAGLGDPEDKGITAAVPRTIDVSISSDALNAARELAAEARALRSAITA